MNHAPRINWHHLHWGYGVRSCKTSQGEQISGSHCSERQEVSERWVGTENGLMLIDSIASEYTLNRIRSASIESLPSDQDLVVQSDYILSIVPPRDALATARRIADACKLSDTATKRESIEDPDGLPSRRKPYYVDLNATSAQLSSEVGSLFADSSSPSSVLCHFLDGGIIGAPPSPNQDGNWKKPSMVISGSVDLPPSFGKLAETLNMKLVSPRIGAASTLKLSFAALTKGFTALSILSFSTVQRESLLPELLEHLEEYSPPIASIAGKGVIGMAPKAYRWVDEMRGIGETLDTEGCWDGLGENVYGSFAEVYRKIAEETVLGEERVGNRERGTTVEDVADIIASGNTRKTSGGGEDSKTSKEG